MKIFEPHIHMYSRNTRDYAEMATAGIRSLVEPGGFWLGHERKHPETCLEYFDHLLNFEHTRAAKAGITYHCTFALNPKEAHTQAIRERVLAELPRYLEHPLCCALGEVGYDSIDDVEEQVVLAQLEMAKQRGLPVLVHTPHVDKLEGTERLIANCRDVGIDPDLVEIDHCTEEQVKLVVDAGFWCGFTIYPVTKLSPERAVAIFKQFGTDRMLVNSSADWGPSDPLSVPKLAVLMQQSGFDEETVQRLVWDNPVRFFGQSGRLVETPLFETATA
ncbi:MAG: TatD family hydrolase [Planctomycetes bacterium]|nr:TatD family hydrolase [Planctomycetota bacterium]